MITTWLDWIFWAMHGGLVVVAVAMCMLPWALARETKRKPKKNRMVLTFKVTLDGNALTAHAKVEGSHTAEIGGQFSALVNDLSQATGRRFGTEVIHYEDHAHA